MDLGYNALISWGYLTFVILFSSMIIHPFVPLSSSCYLKSHVSEGLSPSSVIMPFVFNELFNFKAQSHTFLGIMTMARIILTILLIVLSL
jgi:hypothetical protein